MPKGIERVQEAVTLALLSLPTFKKSVGSFFKLFTWKGLKKFNQKRSQGTSACSALRDKYERLSFFFYLAHGWLPCN